LRQEDWELKARLGYMASSRTAWAAQGDLGSTNKQTNQPRNKNTIFFLIFFQPLKNVKIILYTQAIGEEKAAGTPVTGNFIYFFVNCLYIYSYAYTLFGPFLALPLPHRTSRQNLFCPLLQFC
jgi:hypothetical protein